MNNEVKNYTVVSADWELNIDSVSHRCAAIEACIFAFGKFKEKLLMSTTIMVNESILYEKNDLQNVEFFATYDILNELGLKNKSRAFYEFTENYK